MRRSSGRCRSDTVLSDEEVFCENSSASLQTVKRRLRASASSHIACSECGIGQVYNGKPLTLQVDHINGCRTDNRLINLRWLCPNCHSQTDTFTGRNIKRATVTCISAGCASIQKTRGLCNKHYLVQFGLVKAGETSWEELEAQGVILPRRWEWGSKLALERRSMHG